MTFLTTTDGSNWSVFPDPLNFLAPCSRRIEPFEELMQFSIGQHDELPGAAASARMLPIDE
ncbi:hypothetical protein WK09_00515 [Burkholderia ubonensis]|nr:hypothetical protein WK09_00515 [Burkholderia ubonensis]KVR74089.1 hypothetical protein WK20_28750 [Burkholderia ubonensis]KVU67316.1 hypothetical protein WK73_26190 [Burkholderia ubonensis]KVW34205.1 hypothetical protein WK95_26715 [Burkholderia ubonensis]KWC06114.1 hypothetical protein WL43_18185 [Burkholderia ubonensis]